MRYGELRIHEVLSRIKLHCRVSAKGCMVGSELLQGEAGFSLGGTWTGTVGRWNDIDLIITCCSSILDGAAQSQEYKQQNSQF